MADLSVSAESSSADELSPIAVAARGREITGLQIFQKTTDEIPAERVQELVSEMNADQPLGGADLSYGEGEPHRLRFWGSKSSNAPIIAFVHGGSWRSGTHLDSIGSAKVGHLRARGYAFATINYTLIPSVTVADQVQEVANAVGYLVRKASELSFDPNRVVLMGHSSGGHVVTLLGTDPAYLERAGLGFDILKAVISLDGSNYNAMAEIIDSPGSIADNMMAGLGTDPHQLRHMSPTYHACAPNAQAFLLLHVLRQGDVRQAVELAAALNAAGTNTALHVFEGPFFEGHMQMLLRLGSPDYAATLVMDNWLAAHVPI